MGKASSSKKIARAARAGGRTSGVRQRNLMFPAAIGAIVLAGSAMVVLAWNDHRDTASSVPPVAFEDHWHAAYGIYVCGEWLPPIPTFEDPNDIHTHGDGVIHIHPFAASAAGENARLGVFLDGAGIELSDDKLTVGDETWEEGEDQCDGEDGELVVASWQDVETTDEEPALIPSDFGDQRFRENGEGYTIAFVPEGETDIPKPESASQLEALGAVDSGQTPDSTLPGETPESTVPGETTVPASAPEGATTTAAGGATTTAPPAGEPSAEGES